MRKKTRVRIGMNNKVHILHETLIETEVSGLPDKKFKITVIRILIELRRIVHEKSENFNRERKY